MRRGATLPAAWLALAAGLQGQPSAEVMELGQEARLVHGGDMVLGRLDGLVHDPARFPAEPWPRHPDFPSRARLLWEAPSGTVMKRLGLTPEMVARATEALGHWEGKVNSAAAEPATRLAVEDYRPEPFVFFETLRKTIPKIEAVSAGADGTEVKTLRVPTLEEALERAPEPDGYCTRAYREFYHFLAHDPAVTPVWDRRFRGTILTDHPQTGVVEFYSGTMAATHVSGDYRYQCVEELPADNYSRPALSAPGAAGILATLGEAGQYPAEERIGVLRLYRSDGACAATVGHSPLFNGIFLQYADADSEGCDAGAARHEIGHVLGFHHEHQRADRDAWIEVRWDRIEPRLHSQYEAGHLGLRPYAWESIMHYGAEAGLESVPPGVPLGSEEASPADVAAFDELYGFPWRGLLVSTQPPGGTLLYGGERIQTPAALFPAAGTLRRLAWDDAAGGAAIVVHSEDEREQASLERTYQALPGGSRALFARWSNGELGARLLAPLDTGTRWIGAAARLEHRVEVVSGLDSLGSAAVSPATVGSWFLDRTHLAAEASPLLDGYRFHAWSDSYGESSDLAWLWSLQHQRPGHNPVRWRVQRPLALTAEWLRADWRHVSVGGRRELPGGRAAEVSEGTSFRIETVTSRAQFPWTRGRGPVTLTDVNNEWEYFGLRWAGGVEEAGRRLTFARWSDGLASEERPVELPATGGVSVDAVFREECALSARLASSAGRALTDTSLTGSDLAEGSAQLRVRAVWSGPSASSVRTRLVNAPGEDLWLPCGARIEIEPRAAAGHLAFSHWRGSAESAAPALRFPLDGPRRVTALFRPEGTDAGERERQLLEAREAAFPAFAQPRGLSFSGRPGSEEIPSQRILFKARSARARLSCSVGFPGGGLLARPETAARLDPPAFLADSYSGRSMEVSVSGAGLPAGEHSFWIECDTGRPDRIRIPVAWTLTAPPAAESGFQLPAN